MSAIVLALPLLLLLGDKVEVATLKAGSGPKAAKGDLLTVEYKGTLKNGKQFDSSVGKAPFVFELGAGQVIKGWDQGLDGAKRGAKLRLKIPASLAYGNQAMGDIPANSPLQFDITVLRVDKKGTKKMIEIQEIAAGSGPAVKDGDTVDMHYTGSFLNGVKFDSSRDRGQAFSFKVGSGQVIQGFDMAVLGMKKGGKRKVTIPPHLAYGERGAGGVIPGNSTLVFDIEITGVR